LSSYLTKSVEDNSFLYGRLTIWKDLCVIPGNRLSRLDTW